MTLDLSRIQKILDAAASEDRFSLLEHEVYAVLAAAGCRVPRLVVVARGQEISEADLASLGGDAVMLKVVSKEIAHKTEVGGVAKVAATRAAVSEGIARMLAEVPARYARQLEARSGHGPAAYEGLSGAALEKAIARDIEGVMVVERVKLEGEGVGSESIFALRHSREFGPVLTMGIGGIDTELLGESARKGVAVATGSALSLDAGRLLELFSSTLAGRRLSGNTRAGKRLVEDGQILRVIEGFRAIAEALGQDGEGEGFTITELEVNPFGAAQGELIALDGLLKFRKKAELPLARPLESIDRMMRPKSLAVIGVSAKGMNMGRIILRNVLESGFPKDRAYVIRPETTEIDGVRCVPDVASLPERVDLLVVAVAAEQVPELMEQLVTHDKAVGVILIPGGMAEKAGGEVLEARLKAALRKARSDKLPLVANGGNCLGIVSRPGSYHTLFIPTSKLPLRQDARANVALISQSGAYMITRMSKLAWMSPRYAISAGNQADLTISDYLRNLSQDPEVRTFGVYVEGFKDGDGLAFARAVEPLVKAGRDVVFYKAGRTAEGKHATSGHTASLAGDYDVCEAIVAQAGAMVARSFAEFSDLLKLSSFLGAKKWKGTRLAALSNAGYEAVGIADALGGEGWRLELAKLEKGTRERLAAALAKGKLDALVDVRNPLDLTPMANEEAHEEALRAFLFDATVDLVLCATVPLTPAMATLANGVPAEQSISNPGSLPCRLAKLIEQTDKPLVASVDSGAIFDPMARAFEEQGVPCFRSADEAVRAMGLFARSRLANAR